MNAVIYARYSSSKQNDSYSIEEQLDSCTKKATQEKYTVIKSFEDRAQSAKTMDRPALASLLAYIMDKKNNVDALFIYDISRLSRNQIDFAIIKKELSKTGVIVHSVNGVPNDSLEGDLVQDILARVSQYKNEIDAVKIKGGMRNRVLAGYALRPVRGYKWNKDASGRSIIVPDDTFDIFRSLWLKIANEKLTIAQALKYVNKFIPKSKLTKSSLSRLLENKLYFGILSYPNYPEEVRGIHKPMIDEETFWKVREILTGRSHLKTKFRQKVNPDFPLTRNLFCPHCKGSISAAKSKGKNRYYNYYFCRNRKTCKYNVSVSEVHTAFEHLLQTIIPSDEMLLYVNEMIKEKYESNHKDLIASSEWIEQDLKKLEEKRGKALELLLDGTLEKKDYSKIKQEIEIQLIAKQSLLSEKKMDRLDIDSILNFTTFYFKNLVKLWQRYPVETKIALQCSTFPKGLTFENGVCRTPEFGPAYALLQQKVSLGDPNASGFEHQLQEYINIYNRFNPVIYT